MHPHLPAPDDQGAVPDVGHVRGAAGSAAEQEAVADGV